VCVEVGAAKLAIEHVEHNTPWKTSPNRRDVTVKAYGE